MSGTVKLSIPFESLAESIKDLSFGEKYRLLDILEEQIAQAEEEMLERDPDFQAEIQKARAEYQSGDYVTIDEYIARRKGRAS